MILDIVKHPHESLRQKCIPVEDITKKVKKLCKDMVQTMNVNDGAGLSAPQVDSNLRVIVMKDYYTHQDIIMVNPQIIHSSIEMESASEGCLSIPDHIVKDIPRHKSITVEYLTVKGSPYRTILNGMNSRIVQHEIDHLDGKLIIDFESSIS